MGLYVAFSTSVGLCNRYENSVRLQEQRRVIVWRKCERQPYGKRVVIRSCEQASAEQASAEQASAEQASAEQVSAEQASVEQASADDGSVAFVISQFEARDFLNLKTSGLAVAEDAHGTVEGEFSINLGYDTLCTIGVSRAGISRAGDARTLATWKELEKMSKRGRTGAFELFTDGESAPLRIAMESALGAPLSLLPAHARSAPTLVHSGFTMHRMKQVTPQQDTQHKLHALRPHGRVLDVCTGLGYTALGMACMEEVQEIVTVERDADVLRMVARNPWSKAVLMHPKVSSVVGDAADVMHTLRDGQFDCVVHDPPARAMGGVLYAQTFYTQLCRVLCSGGRMFHYIGDPDSKESGRLYNGIRQRLRDAGFTDVRDARDAFGVVATRP